MIRVHTKIDLLDIPERINTTHNLLTPLNNLLRHTGEDDHTERRESVPMVHVPERKKKGKGYGWVYRKGNNMILCVGVRVIGSVSG